MSFLRSCIGYQGFHTRPDILPLHKYFVVRTSSTWLNWIGVKNALVNVVVCTHLGLISVTGYLFQFAVYIGRVIIAQRTDDAWLLSESEIFKMYEQLRVSPIKLLVSKSWNILLPKESFPWGVYNFNFDGRVGVAMRQKWVPELMLVKINFFYCLVCKFFT